MALLTARRSRPHPGFIENGDGIALRERVTDTLLMLVDGVGHGRHAAHACEAAMGCFEASEAADLMTLLRALNEALSTTRGAAVGLVQIPHGATTVRHLGVGNVGAMLWVPGGSRTLVSANGILGRLTRFQAPAEFPTLDHQLLLLHSDGIPTRATHTTLPTWDGHLEPLADRLFAHAIERDDASLLLAQLRHR